MKVVSFGQSVSTAKATAAVECRFHDLRHTTVTRLLERGQAFAVVADIMGWSAATAVRMAKRYGHIGPSAKRAAMAALNAPLPGEPKQETPTAKPNIPLVARPTTVQ